MWTERHRETSQKRWEQKTSVGMRRQTLDTPTPVSCSYSAVTAVTRKSVIENFFGSNFSKNRHDPSSLTSNHVFKSFVWQATVWRTASVKYLRFTNDSCLLMSSLVEGSLEVKLSTIWTDGKAEVGRVREEKRRKEKIREEKESEERRCMCLKR